MQQFSNNAQTTLGANLSDSATAATVASATGFAALTAGQYELVTIDDGTNREIVKVTARSGTAWTIARAHEGTTARAWPSGTRVSARLTAGTLAGLPIDSGGGARGANAVNLQPGRAADANVASGAESIAVGYNTQASGANASAVGNNNVASGPYAIAMGWGSSATAHGSAALASGADATGAFSLAIGDGSDATQDSAIAIGRSAQAVSTSAVAVGKDAAVAASSDNAIAIGNGSDAIGYAAVAVGWSAQATSDGALALGDHSVASGEGSMAVGFYARAAGDYSSALGRGKTFASHAIAIDDVATTANSVVLRGFRAIKRDEWNDQYERSSAGSQAAFCTPYVDLSVPPNWAAATAYDNGDIVRPTTGGAVQYRAWTDWPVETGIHATATSTATEPTWPGAGDSVDLDADGDHSWIGIDWSDGYLTEQIPAGLAFFPTELAFICHEHSTLTGTPNISIGTAATPGLLVDADDVTITGAHQIYRFTLANPTPAIPSGTAIKITVNTAASAGRCVGRFLLSGYFVENPTNAV